MHGEGKEGDVELILNLVPNINGRTICAMGDALCGPVGSFLNKFRHEFEFHIKEKQCDIKDKLDLL
jgi:NADH-quinone oxidoreductase subunit F